MKFRVAAVSTALALLASTGGCSASTPAPAQATITMLVVPQVTVSTYGKGAAASPDLVTNSGRCTTGTTEVLIKQNQGTDSLDESQAIHVLDWGTNHEVVLGLEAPDNGASVWGYRAVVAMKNGAVVGTASVPELGVITPKLMMVISTGIDEPTPDTVILCRPNGR